jgi:hypothetical protein
MSTSKPYPCAAFHLLSLGDPQAAPAVSVA